MLGLTQAVLTLPKHSQVGLLTVEAVGCSQQQYWRAALRQEVSSPCCAPAGQQPSLHAKASCRCSLAQQP